MLLAQLSEEIKDYYLKQGKRAVFQLGENASVILISQAPGRKVNETGIPWNDQSGITLRSWLGVTAEQFYNPEQFAIMPIDFCYPGRGPHGDLPPDKSCATRWHPKILAAIHTKPLKILIGQYAIDFYLKDKKKPTLPETIQSFRDYLPEYFPLVHPSPRNKKWLRDHPWFLDQTLPSLKKLVQEKLKG